MLLPALLIGVALTVWTYRRTVPRTSPSRRRMLIALRSVATALIIFVLFQPVLTLTKTQERLPRIAVLLDHSRSMLLPAQSGDTTMTRLSAIKKNITSIFPEVLLKNRNGTSVELFAEKATPLDTPLASILSSITADGAVTDIASAFSSVAEQEKSQNISAVILFSDGAYTAGVNPLYNATQLGIPVFSVGVGDSSEHRDLAITSLFTNDIATVGTSQPIDITIHSSGAQTGEKTTVTVFAENEKIGEQEVMLKEGSNDEQITFDFIPKQEGSVKLTAKIAPFTSGEATTSNNISIKYVNVLKNKFQIILFAGAPSSDVSFIKDYFNGRKEIELTTFIQKQGAEFYEGVPSADKLKSADLIMLVGFPISSTSSESIELVKQLVIAQGKSLLFVPSHAVDLVKLKQLEEALPFSISNTTQSNNELSVSASVNATSLANPILRADKEQTAAPKWESLAPLTKTETHFVPKAESEVIAEATLQGVKIGEPLLLSRSVGRAREIAFTAYGLWKWKLTSFGRERAFAALSRTKDSTVASQSALDIFLGNATRWLVMRDDRKRVRIEPIQRLYDAGESIEFTAQVYDESYVPVDNAIVSVKITGSTLASPTELALEPLSNGRYSAKLPQGLAAGDYVYNGNAALNNKSIGSDGGRFNVGEYSVEFAEPRMRADLMREIADRTGGKFYTTQNDASLLNDIRSLASFAPKKFEERSEYEARTAWYILVLAIALLGTEWFLRKRSGML